ncbi:hypothetical protein SCMU_15940 [Sinomonas cyclohexanicum]|uniref:Uncharacterized protein n=1 Tax=Sinomonas cyclohexanicum TaxID=322009 RepID=A0ABM7PU27_SINCY|nr:hypothetical protein SCMU_15940 [Corynebacterium cyclohexanicum]
MPNVWIAQSFAAGGAKSTTAPPTAETGLSEGLRKPAHTSPARTPAAAASRPAIAAKPRALALVRGVRAEVEEEGSWAPMRPE